MTRFMLLSVALVIAMVQVAAANPIVLNGGFETSTIVPGDPRAPELYAGNTGETIGMPLDNVANWTFGSHPSGFLDGLICPATAWGTAIGGTQAAFVEQSGWIQQTMTASAAGTFTVTFSASGPTMAPLYTDPVQVKLDSTVLTFGGATTVTPTGGVLTSYTSDAISIDAGTHTLRFSGTSGDVYAVTAIDNVSVPEPSAVCLVVTGLFGLLAYAWRKRN